ncbi:uncharacterized protein VDAG_09942 [Verticillium dahliae VdLs.17]|uniref:Uncharacterized protein n=1 Tax=Verticillium dahliae (strain VdLs.17 / ATCC MYA-4575 / FGSC 10137) TaxID=498257 RepID=G2XIG0_VERDV|nr:uncharacterized protein VDAG_09942 [Verticillium dahliae VdLs.17]EGY19608.1 hypothetical protein VDAG_09942 [Verticillium dahliae VdLs.17]
MQLPGQDCPLARSEAAGLGKGSREEVEGFRQAGAGYVDEEAVLSQDASGWGPSGVDILKETDLLVTGNSAPTDRGWRPFRRKGDGEKGGERVNEKWLWRPRASKIV